MCPSRAHIQLVIYTIDSYLHFIVISSDFYFVSTTRKYQIKYLNYDTITDNSHFSIHLDILNPPFISYTSLNISYATSELQIQKKNQTPPALEQNLQVTIISLKIIISTPLTSYHEVAPSSKWIEEKPCWLCQETLTTERGRAVSSHAKTLRGYVKSHMPHDLFVIVKHMLGKLFDTEKVISLNLRFPVLNQDVLSILLFDI